MKKNRAAIIIAIISVLYLVSCSTDPWTSFLPEQEGKYGIIGTTKIVLDDPRQLMVQAWYPAASKGAGVIDPMITKVQADAMAGFHIPIGTEQLENRVPSSSWTDAPIMPTDKPYPIIIFDHGFEGYEKQNMTQMEELASQGYVVFSVNHPGESTVTVYPDGEVVLIDHERYPSLIAKTRKQRIANGEETKDFFTAIRSDPTDEEKIELIRVFSSIPRITTLALPINERTRDILYVMEAIAEASKEGEFFGGLIDIENVGMYGHSMGGNVTHAIASMEDLPVNLKAAANLDGPQLIFPGEPVTIPQVPFMIAYSTGQFVDGVAVDMHGVSDWVLNECEYETWRAVFNGATHVNFSDLTYVEALEGHSTGDIDGRAMGIAQEKLIVAWFDRHLKGETTDMEALERSYDLWELNYEL